jgi:excisionase family DNA binding protein
MLFGGEVAAWNFVLYVGHLGRRELVVQPATSKGRR